jgi:bacterioferritin
LPRDTLDLDGHRTDVRGPRNSIRRGEPVAKPVAKKTARPAQARAKARTAAELERPAPRKVTREELIDLLNDDLAKEFMALVQYVQHAAAMSGPQYDAIKAELIVHSNEEHAHAISLADQIDFMGGVPTVDVAPAHISPDSKIMLEQDLDGELDAIFRYRERIAQAEMLQEYGLRRALEDILIIEEEHARDLQDALDL